MQHSSFNHSQRILLVDDDQLVRSLISQQIRKTGYQVVEATNGKEALEILQKPTEVFSAILLDREMPEMDGIELTHQLKKDQVLRHIPIIMITGHGAPEQIQEGINAGVFYYLVKPLDPKILASVLSSALREHAQFLQLRTLSKAHASAFGLIDSGCFYFTQLHQAESLAGLLSSAFPDPDRALAGIGELLINALEHGLLGITYAEKTKLISTGLWRDEIAKRSRVIGATQKVEVVIEREHEKTIMTVTDPGAGFEWRKYMQLAPERALDNHGRGIAYANGICFDRIEYNDIGNRVTAIAANVS